VFYFGNAVGEVEGIASGTVPNQRYPVTAGDTGLVRTNQLGFNALVTNRYDLNKNGSVNAGDTGIVRTNQSGFGILRVITGALARTSAFVPPVEVPGNVSTQPSLGDNFALASDSPLTDGPSSDAVSNNAFFAVDEYFCELERKKSKK